MKRQIRAVGRHVATRIDALRRGLAEPGLRHLQLTSLAFNAVEYATLVALGVYAFDAGGALGVGVATVVRTLPALIAGPLLAVLADRHSRPIVMAIGLFVRGAFLIAIAAAVTGGAPFALVLALAGLDAIGASSFYPAYGALIPELALSPQQLATATALASATENGGSLGGPLVAAVLLAAAGVSSVFIAAGVTVVLAGVLALRLTSTRRLPASRGQAAAFRSDLADGVAAAARNPQTRAVVGAWAFESLAVGVSEVFVVLIAIDLIGWGDPGVGLLNAALGAGGLIGSIAMASLARNRPFGRYLGIGIVVFGAGIAFNGVFAVGLGALLAHVAIGHAGAQVDVAAQTLLQRTVAEDHLGRVLGAFEGIYWGARGVGAILASWASVALGVRSALLGIGSATTLIGVALLLRLARIDRGARVPDDQLDLIRPIPLFAALPVPTVERLAARLEPRGAEPGEVIIRQGDRDCDLYVIRSGRVAVELNGRPVATLEAGDVFGEIAPLRGIPRTATVRAVDATDLYALDGDVFCAAVSGHTTSLDHAADLADTRIAELRRFGGRTGR